MKAFLTCAAAFGACILLAGAASARSTYEIAQVFPHGTYFGTNKLGTCKVLFMPGTAKNGYRSYLSVKNNNRETVYGQISPHAEPFQTTSGRAKGLTETLDITRIVEFWYSGGSNYASDDHRSDSDQRSNIVVSSSGGMPIAIDFTSKSSLTTPNNAYDWDSSVSCRGLRFTRWVEPAR